MTHKVIIFYRRRNRRHSSPLPYSYARDHANDHGRNIRPHDRDDDVHDFDHGHDRGNGHDRSSRRHGGDGGCGRCP